MESDRKLTVYISGNIHDLQFELAIALFSSESACSFLTDQTQRFRSALMYSESITPCRNAVLEECHQVINIISDLNFRNTNFIPFRLRNSVAIEPQRVFPSLAGATTFFETALEVT